MDSRVESRESSVRWRVEPAGRPTFQRWFRPLCCRRRHGQQLGNQDGNRSDAGKRTESHAKTTERLATASQPIFAPLQNRYFVPPEAPPEAAPADIEPARR